MPRIDINMDQVMKGLSEDKNASKKVLQRTIGDMRKSGPGWVSKAVREEYNIKASDVKAAARTTKGTSRLTFGGATIDSVALIFQGRVLTPTHFGMKPTSRPKKKKSYRITAEIKKGQRKELSSKAFLAGTGGGGKQIPFQRTGASRLPIEAIKTLSIPQMIQDGKWNLKPRVEEVVNEKLEKRFKHHADHLLGKSTH